MIVKKKKDRTKGEPKVSIGDKDYRLRPSYRNCLENISKVSSSRGQLRGSGIVSKAYENSSAKFSERDTEFFDNRLERPTKNGLAFNLERRNNMSRLGCFCGNTLSNVDCPSQNIIRVFKKDNVERLLKKNRNLELWDVYSEDEEYDYWWCEQCGRVYVCPLPGQNVELVCNPIAIGEQIVFAPEQCVEFYSYSDTLLDRTIEKELHISWKDFFHKNSGKRYFYDSSKNTIWVTDENGSDVVSMYDVRKIAHETLEQT